MVLTKARPIGRRDPASLPALEKAAFRHSLRFMSHGAVGWAMLHCTERPTRGTLSSVFKELMGMPDIGDRVEVTSWKAAPRVGTVIAISDRPITVRWDSGEQTSLIPGPGVLNVVAKGRGRKLASKKATAIKKTQPSKTPTLSPSSKTRGPARWSR
jgi:hypothetical protein